MQKVYIVFMYESEVDSVWSTEEKAKKRFKSIISDASGIPIEALTDEWAEEEASDEIWVESFTVDIDK